MTVNIPISGLPAALLPLTGAEITALVQNGITVEAPINALSGLGELLVITNVTVKPGVFYGVKTATAAFTLTLPLISTVSPPAWLEIADLDNSAGTNNITIAASGADLIYSHGVGAATFVVNVNNTITRILANTNGWCAIQYGF